MKAQLIAAATAAREHAYAPYSGFTVGAAVLTEKGIFTGANVENASYGLTCCGDRAAIFNAISQGAREFHAMAIVTGADEPAMPCGACRQVMSEFFDAQTPIFVANTDGKVRTTTIAELLPLTFKL